MIIHRTRTFGLNSVGNRELAKVLKHDQIIVFEKDDAVGGWGSVKNELAGKPAGAPIPVKECSL